ncbi:MAG: HPr family phosphocarrier protein [Candidatus Eisenbacteria bacterium]|nr:HPr family phosphocarrier protein [Candidatus Eisenbacteria bacterium]
MSEATVEIDNELGLHARPAAEFVKEASKFSSEIFVVKNGVQINGKSIMGILTLAAERGSRITIKAKGTDEDLAVQALVSLVKSRFGEK